MSQFLLVEELHLQVVAESFIIVSITVCDSYSHLSTLLSSWGQLSQVYSTEGRSGGPGSSPHKKQEVHRLLVEVRGEVVEAVSEPISQHPLHLGKQVP